MIMEKKSIKSNILTTPSNSIYINTENKMGESDSNS